MIKTFLTVILLMAIAACSSPAPPEKGPVGSLQKPNILLIVIDTIRADYLGCYGASGNPTPNLDRLAADGTRFQQALTVVPTTLSSFASMLTSRYPRQHGVPFNGVVLDAGYLTLPEVMVQNGYHTAAFISSYAMHSSFGINQGFEFYQDCLEFERTADDTVDSLLQWMKDYPDTNPYFVMLHLFDPHEPFMPPMSLAERMYMKISSLMTGRARGTWEDINKAREGALTETGEPTLSARQLGQLYSREITFTDSQIGRLMEGLRQQGMLKNTHVVITGDHGETLWEHRKPFDHGPDVYHTSIHVPLIFSSPELDVPSGHVLRTPVQSIDLAPTLLDMVGMPCPEEFMGHSYRHLIHGMADKDSPAPEPFFIEATKPLIAPEEIADTWPNADKPRAIFSGRLKLIQYPVEDNRLEFYDLAIDPEEKNNLIDTDDPQLKDQIRVLHQTLNHWHEETLRQQRYQPRLFQIKPKTINGLKALGYLE
jgi:arylsulfatase A-like enzyme